MRNRFLITTLALSALTTSTAIAQDVSVLNADPDYCINALAGFPNDDVDARYQFLRLTEELGRDITPEFRAAATAYGDGDIEIGTPMLDVIEDIANPVLRQAAPQITVSSISYVTDFATICAPFITGQIDSLRAFDPALANAEFNAVIAEDALFLRQIFSDSLHRLGADQDPAYAAAVAEYANALIITRDAVEFSTFEAELDELEILFMTDLDGRLARSNDMINEEIDQEILGDSIALSDSLSKAASERAKQERIYTLFRIMGGR